MSDQAWRPAAPVLLDLHQGQRGGVAQQLGLLANLPSVAATTLIAFNAIQASLAVAIIGAALLLGLNRLGWRLTSAMFDRERLITGIR